MDTLCRDCGFRTSQQGKIDRCPTCGSPRVISHPELFSLSIAHIDCDSFYASVEKRDNPSLANKPVIVGGGKRGVVAACCYIARMRGVHSAMPMYKAKKACPDAVVIKPNMSKYRIAGKQIRAIMLEMTPLIEPLSLDEAFLDLSGTEKLHKKSPAETLTEIIRRIQSEVGVSASIGLSYNKFLAKTGSDLDKPRGFAVIGKAEAQDFLASRPVKSIFGVGKALTKKLENDGIRTIVQLRELAKEDLLKEYGTIGSRLYHFSRGEDNRTVNPSRPVKSVSAETTFNEDVTDFAELKKRLWSQCERVGQDLRSKGIAGRSITLKLKTAEFKQLSRSRHISSPTQLAEVLFQTALPLLEKEANGTPYRLIGIGAADLCSEEDADTPDLLNPELGKQAKMEKLMDAARDKFGKGIIQKGRSLK
ncbi:MAG: DNA polymerase IV [Rhodospirillales bacterium]|nr:DNA polymerase IV [Rhodospirillales bacterium]